MVVAVVGFNIVSLRIFYANRAAKGMVRSFAGCVSDADRVIFCSRNRFSINNSPPIPASPHWDAIGKVSVLEKQMWPPSFASAMSSHVREMAHVVPVRLGINNSANRSN